MSKVDLIHHKWSPFPNREGRRKGFTIAELVVAMAIIFIVSATAIGIINTQNTVHLRTTQTVEATNMAENAIECFRYAVENTDAQGGINKAFYDAFKKTGYLDLEKYTDTNSYSEYEIESNGMLVTITIEETTLTFEAVAKDNGKEIGRAHV